MPDDEYADNAELDMEKAGELRDDAARVHEEAENIEDLADSVEKLGGMADATRLRAEGERIEAKADDLDRRADLLVDAAGMWREAGDDERRAAETGARADAAWETARQLKERINATPMSDDELTEARIEAGRADGELAALRERTDTLTHEAGFDIKLAETEEAAAGFVRPEPPAGPESEPNPDLMPPE
jgi:DNA repair exonuclease SbcCD ATPase subunit